MASCYVFVPKQLRTILNDDQLFLFMGNDTLSGHYKNTPIQIYRNFHVQKLKIFRSKKSGPSYSKLKTSLVNDSLKFTSSDRQIC